MIFVPNTSSNVNVLIGFPGGVTSSISGFVYMPFQGTCSFEVVTEGQPVKILKYFSLIIIST